MDELTLFYYLCWLLYIVGYFFMPFGSVRKLVLIIVLSFICLSSLDVSVSSITISSSFIMLIIGTVILFGFTGIRMYESLIIFVCMISYTSLLIWEKMAPVLFFMPANIMIASFIVLLVSLLIKSFGLRVIIVIAGLTLGQLIYESLLYMYVRDEFIGSYHYINYLLVTIILLIMIENIKNVITFIITYPTYKYYY